MPADPACDALPRPVAGAGPVSIRLAEIDTRLDHLYVLQGENAERLGAICAALTHVEQTTAEINTTISGLLASVRKHPLLARFIGG